MWVFNNARFLHAYHRQLLQRSHTHCAPSPPCRHYGQLSGALNVFRQQQFERLRVLAKNSSACTSSLKEKLAKAEDILKLVGICRKMETDQEKVLPFYSQEVPQEPELEAELAEEQRKIREQGEVSAVGTAWYQQQRTIVQCCMLRVRCC